MGSEPLLMMSDIISRRSRAAQASVHSQQTQGLHNPPLQILEPLRTQAVGGLTVSHQVHAFGTLSTHLFCSFRFQGSVFTTPEYPLLSWISAVDTQAVHIQHIHTWDKHGNLLS